MKPFLWKAGGIALDTIPPFVATLYQFPVWIDRSSGATVSGLFVLLIVLSAVPVVKIFHVKLKSPSIWLTWAIIFGILIALRRIVDEMIFIAAIGAASNFVGSVMYKRGERLNGTSANTAGKPEGE